MTTKNLATKACWLIFGLSMIGFWQSLLNLFRYIAERL